MIHLPTPTLSQYNRANLQNIMKRVNIDSDYPSRSGSQLSEYQAMSTSKPSTDLLLCSVYYRCALCNVSLTNFTRLIGLTMKADEEGFSNYCAACFAGSSPTNRRLDNGNHPKDYQYFAIPPLSNQYVPGEGWSLEEICGLFEVIERYGIDNWKTIYEQFSKIVGTNRKDNELRQKFVNIMKKQQIWTQEDIEDYLILSTNQQCDLSKSFNASKKSEQQRIYSNNFNEIMKNHNIYDDTQYSNDNYHQYYLKILIDSKQISQKYSSSKIQKISQDHFDILSQIEQFRELSTKHEENTAKAQAILYKLYFNALGREDKYQRSFNRDILTENIGVENDDLELEKLKTFEGLENIIEDLMSLKVKRLGLLKNSRSNIRVSFASSQREQLEMESSPNKQQKIKPQTLQKNKKKKKRR